MLIHQSNNLIIGFDDMSVFECDKLKANWLPSLDHFIEVFLDSVFFHGNLTDFDADIDVFHEAHIEDFREGEFLIGEDFEAYFLRYLGPVSLS